MKIDSRLIIDHNVDFGTVHDLLVALFDRFGGRYNRRELREFLYEFAFSKNVGLETLLGMFKNASNNLQIMQTCHDRRMLSRKGIYNGNHITSPYNIPADSAHLLAVTYLQEVEMIRQYLSEFSGNTGES